MKYRFQHFIDISTSAESMQSITFSVGGDDVIRRCAHLFNAYKYFKLGKITVKFVPASTLPVDPLGMSYEDTDPQTVDPRDQLNPGLVRIVNGEDIMTDFTGLSADVQNGIYEAMLLDPRWYKFNLQSGFKRSAVPLYWQIGQLAQDNWPGATINVPATSLNAGATAITGTASTNAWAFNGATVSSDTSGSASEPRFHYESNFSDSKGLFQVGHRGRMGWLPTDMYQGIWNGTVSGSVPMVHPVPQIRVIQCFLPKANKTLYYYRVYITEEVMFSGLKSIAPYSEISGTESGFRSPDIFLGPPGIYPHAPSDAVGSSIGRTRPHEQSNDGSHDERN